MAFFFVIFPPKVCEALSFKPRYASTSVIKPLVSSPFISVTISTPSSCLAALSVSPLKKFIFKLFTVLNHSFISLEYRKDFYMIRLYSLILFPSRFPKSDHFNCQGFNLLDSLKPPNGQQQFSYGFWTVNPSNLKYYFH